jgi:serine phosphatase RsbU (regulator of sigma subunit)
LVRSLQPGISSQALIDAVLADVAAFVGPAEQHDDITMVAIRFVGEPT